MNTNRPDFNQEVNLHADEIAARYDVEAEDRECMGCHRIMSVAEYEHSRLSGNCTR